MGIIVKSFFFEYGKKAPKNSNYKGIMNTNSLFGEWFEYTHREKATENSFNQIEIEDQEGGSFADYTARVIATKGDKIGKQYFTMSNEGKLYTEADKHRWNRNSRNTFSKDGDIAWSLVVTLDDYELAKEYGLYDQKQWSEVAKISLIHSFEKLHLDPNNMIWWQDYHTNTDHPHMHITFLEKQKTRSRGRLTATEMKHLKSVFITEIAARKRYYDKHMEYSSEALKKIQPLRKEVVQSVKQVSFTTMENVLNLYSQLPMSGRLQYDSIHMKPYREQIDSIVEELLKVDSVQKDYLVFKNKVCDLKENIDQLGYGDISNLWKQQDAKLRKQIANAILAAFKDIDKADLKELKKVKVWKDTTGKEILRKEHQKIVQNLDITKIEKDISKAILENNFDKAKELIRDIPESERTDFLKNSMTILDPVSTADEVLEAKQKLSEEVKDKPSTIKKYLNFLKHKLPMNKKTHHQMLRKVAPILKRSIRSTIKAQGREIEAEIDEFLRNSTKLAPMNYEEKIAKEVAERGGMNI